MVQSLPTAKEEKEPAETVSVKFNQDYRFFPDSIPAESGGVKSGTKPYEAKKGEVLDLNIKFYGIVRKGIATEIKGGK